jgi:type I restriction enzyme R subunit
MSNFDFIKADFPQLYTDAMEAEKLTFISPTSTAVLCRSTFENGVNWLYDHEAKLSRPWRSDLSTLIHEPAFSTLFNRTLFSELNLIRKTGNAAAHGTKISEQDALACLKYLFRFLRFLAIYYGKTTPETQVFDEALIPTLQTSTPDQQQSLQQLINALELKNKAFREAEQAQIQLAKENTALKAELEQQRLDIAKRKAEREKSLDVGTAIPLLVSEAETRRRYIDLSLKECGWTHLQEGRDLEYEVTGMPLSINPSGKGYVDYVLWGDNGLPLAVVEAKKTMSSPKKGKHQAELYANCLEVMHGQRPIIFYSNGFETYLWDDLFSPERQVQGFYSKDELQLLINRRATRTNLREFKVNTAIAGRAYQLEAIKRVAENTVSINKQGQLRSRARQSLLVMATGSGKTRTAAALVDMLVKCHWVNPSSRPKPL